MWHIVWNTHGTWPPKDARGDWSYLAEFYAPLISSGSVVPSHPLLDRYLCRRSEGVTLSDADIGDLHEWLLQLTRTDNGDRVAGGTLVLAGAFLPTAAHLLLQCDRAALNQVVGRLKSRLAALLLFEKRWADKSRRVWGTGFWAAEILRPEMLVRIKTFIDHLAR